MRCIALKLKCQYETRNSASVNSTELGYSFAKEAQDDNGYASTPEGFTKDRPRVQEMLRARKKSRSMQHNLMQPTFVKVRRVARKASSVVNLPDKEEQDDDGYASTSEGFTEDRSHVQEIQKAGSDDSKVARKASSVFNWPDKELPSLYVKSKDGSNAKITTAIKKALYQRPKHKRLFCPFCNDKEGFRGAHKLNRHCERQHKQLVKKWVCIEPEDGIKNQFKPVNDLSNCEACKQGKKYGNYSNAAGHLQRVHFRHKARDRSQSSKMKDESETRDIKDGADRPPMLELKRWVKKIYVNVNDEESRDEEPSGEEIHSDFDEDFSDLLSSDAIAFDSNPLAPDDIQLLDYESLGAPSFSAQNTPSDASMPIDFELPQQMATFGSNPPVPNDMQLPHYGSLSTSQFTPPSQLKLPTYQITRASNLTLSYDPPIGSQAKDTMTDSLPKMELWEGKLPTLYTRLAILTPIRF